MRQPTSHRVDRWWSEDDRLALWTLSPVQITSALWRLVREGALEEGDALAAEARSQELALASYHVTDIEGVKALARRLLRVHPLGSADALQLAAAVVWAGGRPQGKTLLTLDERLALAARREGFEVP